MPQLSCKNLSLGYDGKVIIENLNFEIEAGDYVCIVGENGVGKSTLLKTLLALRKAMGGTIMLGEGLSRSDIGYLPQQTQVQKDFPASVMEIIMTGFLPKMGWRFFYTQEEKEKAEKLMEKMGILEYKEKCYRDLSGGQQQRVLLVRALCATEKLLFLDEPVAGLDPKAAEDMYLAIERLNKVEKITVVMVTHDIGEASRYAGKVLHLRHDSYFFGSLEDYQNEQKNLWRNYHRESQ